MVQTDPRALNQNNTAKGLGATRAGNQSIGRYKVPFPSSSSGAVESTKTEGNEGKKYLTTTAPPKVPGNAIKVT